MISRTKLNHYLNDYLHAQMMKDYCPNGLQIQGKSEIKKIITGVTASQALVDQAIVEQADAILVHHGYFWKGENPCITGHKKHRMKALLDHEINLFAYHLPLDVHGDLGNNVQLAKIMAWQITGELMTNTPINLGLVGQLADALSADALANHIQHKLQRQPLVITAHNRPIKTLAWCTGGAQDFIEQAATAGVDAYISGEISERTTHLARELGIHYFACGHHATERYGVKALGEHLAKKFDLDCLFIDIDNPV